MSSYVSPVRLGSIPELPAESCGEIKASEGELAVSGKYWLHFVKIAKTVLAHCNMKTEGKSCALNIVSFFWLPVQYYQDSAELILLFDFENRL